MKSGTQVALAVGAGYLLGRRHKSTAPAVAVASSPRTLATSLSASWTRRVDQGNLTGEQIEKIGLTLMALEERMGELREHFGLRREDLNIDLGPLGPLLPKD